MASKYIKRPEPLSSVSGKRQRISSGPSLELRQLGALPSNLSSFALKPGFAGVANFTTSTTADDDSPRYHVKSYAWVVSPSSTHLYLWQLSVAEEAQVVRLVMPRLEKLGERWFVSLFNTSDATPGVFLVSSSGDVMCWPSSVQGSTCILHSAISKLNVTCTVVRELPGHENVILVATTGLDLFQVSISMEDLTIQSDQLGATKNTFLRDGAALVGRWFGLDSASKNDNVKQSTYVDDLNGASDMDIIKNGNKFVLFVLHVSGMIRCLEINLEDNHAFSKSLWEWKRLSVEVRRQNDYSAQTNLKFNRLFCFQAKDPSSSYLIVTAEADLGVSLHQVKGILSSTPVPRIGAHTETLPHAEPHGQMLTEYAAITASVNVKPEEPLAITVCQAALGNNGKQALNVSCIVFDPLALKGWFHRQVKSAVSGWFAVNSCALDHRFLQVRSLRDTLSEVVVLSCNGAIRGWMDAGDNQDDTRIIPTPRAKSISKRGTSTISTADATRVLGRSFRIFCEAAAQGRDGINDSQQDPDWIQFYQSVGSEALGNAAIQVCRQELDHQPTQRWAEKWSAKGSSAAHPAQDFAPQLVHRHLAAKQARIDGPNGLFPFLKRTGLMSRISALDRLTLGQYSELVHASIGLCRLHSQRAIDMTQEEHSTLSRLLIQGMTHVLMLREDCATEEEVCEKLKAAGLSVPDVFYSQVTSVTDIMPSMQHISKSAAESNALNYCLVTNWSMEALCSAALVYRIRECAKTFEIDAHPQFRPWTDSEDLFNILVEQIRVVGNALAAPQLLEKDTRILLLQMAQLADILLGAMKRQIARESETNAPDQTQAYYTKAMDLALLPIIQVAEAYYLNNSTSVSQAVADLSASSCKVLAEKYVHYESLVRLCDVEAARSNAATAKEMLQDYVDRYQSSLIRIEAVESNEEEKTVQLTGRFGHGLIATAKGAKATTDGDATSFILAPYNQGQHEDVNKWSLWLAAEDGLLLSYTDDGRWGTVEAQEPGLTEVFDISSADSEDASNSWNAIYTCANTCMTIGRNGEVSSLSCPPAWRGMFQFCYEWFLEHKQAYRITQLAQHGFHDDELQELLSDSTQKNGDAAVPTDIEHLKWLYYLRTNNGTLAARVLLGCALVEKESLAQRKTLLSLGKLALWGAQETTSDRLEVELDYACDAQAILESAAGDKPNAKGPYSVPDIEQLHTVLCDTGVATVEDYCLLFTILAREEVRAELFPATESATKKSQLGLFKTQAWTRLISQDIELWRAIVNDYLGNESSVRLADSLHQTKFAQVVSILKQSAAWVGEGDQLWQRWGLDEDAIKVMVADSDKESSMNRVTLSALVHQVVAGN